MAKKGIIYETLNEVKSMDMQKSNDGFMHLSGVFGVCGVRNNNQRVYETRNYAKMVESMQARLKKAPIPGELEHPQSMNICTENISHRIDSISIDENGVVSGEITLLNTPKGKIAQAIVEGGLPLFISSRAQGQVDKNGNVTLEMLQTYDLVGSPGFSQAELHLNEGQCFESINENMCFIGESFDDETINEKVEVYADGEELVDASTSKTIGVIYDDGSIKFSKDINDQDREKYKKAILKNKNLVDKYDVTDKSFIKENNTEDMNEQLLKEIQEKLAELEDRNEELQEQVEALQEELAKKEDIDLERLAEGIEDWVVNEYSPKLQQWITEEYSAKLQQWITEEYSKSCQKWLIEQFAPEIETWLIEHYSPEVDKWVTESFGKEMKNWVAEEYSEKLQEWITEHFAADLKSQIQESAATQLTETKQEKLGMIDSILEMLENKQIEKPVFGRKANLVESTNLPKYIADMPADARVKYDLASEEVKESISRRAKLYDWSKPNAIANFWENIDFTAQPVTNVLTEGLNNIPNEKERMLRESIRRWRNR